jgi:DnaJ-class molecular chaperone
MQTKCEREEMSDKSDFDADYDRYDDEFNGIDEQKCLVCGGGGMIDNDDPLWYGFDVYEITCTSCGGSGLAKDMTYC